VNAFSSSLGPVPLVFDSGCTLCTADNDFGRSTNVPSMRGKLKRNAGVMVSVFIPYQHDTEWQPIVISADRERLSR